VSRSKAVRGVTEAFEGQPIALLLGAGASRGVSYAHEGAYPSPLNVDFFDLLRRLKPRESDAAAKDFVLSRLAELPQNCRRSMERTFYTLHLRAYLARKLSGRDGEDRSAEERVVASFARCVQALLRKAHGKKTCLYHVKLLEKLANKDSVVSFNYDLVVERTFKKIVERREQRFGKWIYALGDGPPTFDLPSVLKLHGSSNWRVSHHEFLVLTKDWNDLRVAPGYLGHKGHGTTFPIFLPFWDKRIEESPWLQLWQTAFARLRASGSLIVWGYSLPTTDVKAQQLFELAFAKRRFRLCVIDPSSVTRERWRELFPDALY
jgi:hypothetical protein